MTYRIVNFVCFQIGWFACVLGAAWGYPWLGPVVVLVWVGVHLSISKEPKAELLTVVAAGVLGYAADSVLVLAGRLRFDEAAALGQPTTLWMVALWANLGTTLSASLSFLRGRYLLALILGAVGGPIAYWAGERLGAIELAAPWSSSVAAVAVEWAVGMPALVAVDRWAHSRPLPAGTAPVSRKENT